MVRKEFVQNDRPEITLEVLEHENGLVELCVTSHGNPMSIMLDSDDVDILVDELLSARGPKTKVLYSEEEIAIPKFKGIDEEKVKEAQYYSQQKRLLEESMKEYIATIKPTQHIEKELKTIELDALNREVEVTKTKLKENVKRK